MTIPRLSLRYLAVGIHVSRGPEYGQFQSYGRVYRRVHLRIWLFWHVLTSIWHCLALFDLNMALFGTVWYPYVHVPGTRMYMFLGPVCTCSWIWVSGTLYMDPGYGYLGPCIWTLAWDIPLVGPWQYQTGTTPGIPLHHPGYTPAPPTHPARRTESTVTLTSTLS